jgi:hypothetical protein
MSTPKHIEPYQLYTIRWARFNTEALKFLFEGVKGKISNIKTVMVSCSNQFNGKIETGGFDVGLYFRCGEHHVSFQLDARGYNCKVESIIDFKEEYNSFRLVIDDYGCVKIEFLNSELDVRGSYNITFYKPAKHSETHGIYVNFNNYTSYIEVKC